MRDRERDREREGEKKRKREREITEAGGAAEEAGSPLSREPDAALNPRTTTRAKGRW